MKCKVSINGGENARVPECFGELEINGKCFFLRYNFGGAECNLSYDGENLVHKSLGGIPVCMSFSSRGKSLCEIGGGELYGELPLKTQKLKVEILKNAIFCGIEYNLGGENKKMNVSAAINTETGLEEK